MEKEVARDWENLVVVILAPDQRLVLSIYGHNDGPGWMYQLLGDKDPDGWPIWVEHELTDAQAKTIIALKYAGHDFELD